MTRTYLDHNATTPLHPAARAAMVGAFDAFGNPSSIHAEGRGARAIVDDARNAVAALVGTTAGEVVFTSCGSEAVNIALSPELMRDGRGCEVLLTSAGEHPCVLAGHRFGDRADVLPLTPDGTLDLDALRDALKRHEGRRVMLALQAANNETGAIQPVRQAAALVHERGGTVVVDAVQAAGKIACTLDGFDADALAISAHKFGGPKGVGALCFASDRHHVRRGVVRGGGHERGLSAGTENVVGIAGMGAAARVVADGGFEAGSVERRSAIEAALRGSAEVTVFSERAPRLSNTVCVAVDGYDSQVLLINLDLSGVAVSAGSACASGTLKPSHVLTAMGVAPGPASSFLRVSTGWTTTDADIDALAAAFAKAVKAMRPRKAA